MEALDLKAEPRQVKGRAVKHLRQQGLVPVILYGKDVESTPLQVEERDLEKVLEVAGTHQLISLQVNNQRPQLTLARDIQRDVIRRNFIHVDFYAVKMDQKVVAQVPIHLIGESPAVEEQGGVLTQGLDEIEIECLPADLISSIEVSIETLKELNDSIIVADLVVPDNVAILSEPESMVAKVEPPRLIEEDEEEGVSTSAEPEVLTGSKREDDEE
ncbi:MAG: 50S ribosomal protein L25 [Anaerolineaceae bacterium]|nr:50S ribosomal protein L25 [Anaerolineaceae bacterium]